MSASTEAHRLLALMPEGNLLQVWCECGWTCRATRESDCLDYFRWHTSHARPAAG